MQTAEIIRFTLQRPLHVLPDSELRQMMVSSTSYWHSPYWDFDDECLGRKESGARVRWQIPLHDGTLLTDPQHQKLLDWLRRVVWSLTAAPGDGCEPLKPGSMGHVSVGLGHVVPWLVENVIHWPVQLSEDVLDHYLLDLPERLARSGGGGEGDADDAEVSMGAASDALKIIYFVWRQRRCLEEAGIAHMPTRPWPDAKGVNTLAKRISNQARGWIQPLPDEVAVPTLNKAMWFLDVPAKDILRLQGEIEAVRTDPPGQHHSGPGRSDDRRCKRLRCVAEGFEFSPGDTGLLPWHGRLSGCRSVSGKQAATMNRVKQLVKSLQTACTLVLQGFTGMRVSELCGLRAGVDAETGLPVDVEMRLSPSGLNEEFVLRGEVSKGQNSPRDMPWLLGSRRVGDTVLPPGVQAIQILDKLLQPYRALLGTNRLLVGIVARNGLPKTKQGLSRITGERILAGYRSFLEEWVDLNSLPDQSRHATSPNDLIRWRESSGTVITTHQLRKTYAQYVLSVHPDLLPAVKRQFHHINMSITEGGYWGSDTPQIDPVHSVSRQMTAMMLFEAVQGKSKPSGKMGTQVMEGLGELRKLVEGMDMSSSWIRVNNWVEKNGIHANHGTHGMCLPITGTRMECWRKVESRPIGSLEPNYATREASLCAGCGCFMMDERHVPFWRERYIANEACLRRARMQGLNLSSFREVERRAEQAKKKLSGVGEDLSAFEEIIEIRLSENVQAA